MSARWPTVRRPRSSSRAETAAVRRRRPAAHARASAPRPGANGGVPAGQRGILAADRERDPGPRIERLDRRVGPEREDGTGRGERRPGVAAALGPVAPQPSGLCGVAARDATGWTLAAIPAAAKRPTIGRVEQLDVLDPGHERHRRGRRLERRRARPGPPRRRCAWIWVAMPPAAARSTSSRSSLGLGDPHAAPAVGRERPVGLRLDVGQQRRRPRAERPVREALLPADPGATAGFAPRIAPLRSPPRERRVEGVVAQRGAAPGPAAARARTGARRPGTTSPGPGPATAAPGSWTATTPSDQELVRRRPRSGPRARRPRSAGCGRVTSRVAAS